MLESIIDIVRRAGELVRSANDVTAATHEKNGPADLVTEYDLAVQRFLRQSCWPAAGGGFLRGGGAARCPDVAVDLHRGPHRRAPPTSSGALPTPTSPWRWPRMGRWSTPWYMRRWPGSCTLPAWAAGPPSTAGPSTSADGIPATRWWCAAPPSMTAAIRSGTSPSCGISTTGDWTTVGSGRRRWICARWRRAGRRCSSSVGSAVGFRRPGALLVQEAGGCVTTLEGTTIDPLRPGSVFAANALCGGLTAELPRG